jgi:hypothetical protein
MILHRLENRVLRVISDIDGCTLVRDFDVAFAIPWVYDYTTISCRKQAIVIQNHQNPNVRAIRQGKLYTGNARGLNLEAVRPTNV